MIVENNRITNRPGYTSAKSTAASYGLPATQSRQNTAGSSSSIKTLYSSPSPTASVSRSTTSTSGRSSNANSGKTTSIKTLYSERMNQNRVEMERENAARREREDEDKVDVGQLIWGIGDQAATQLAGDVLGAADMLIGTPVQWIMDYSEEKLGLPDRGENFISAYNDRFQEKAREEAEYYAQNASKDELASLINQYGPAILSLIPELALAYFSGGSSLVASGARAAGTIGKLDNYSDMLRMAGTLMKNKSLWGGAARTAGQSFNQALYEGADRNDAMKYAVANGALDFGLNGVGMLRGQAGMETLPDILRKTQREVSPFVNYGKAVLHDGLEAVAQGTGQRGNRAIYDEDVELFSEENPNAVFNPRSMAIDFTIGGAGAAIASTLHGGTKMLDKPAEAASSRLETYRYAREIFEGNKSLTKEQAIDQARLLKELKNGNVMESNQLHQLDMKNPKLQEIFTRETGIPFTYLDNKHDDTLRIKYQMGAMKVRDGETVAIAYKPLERLGNELYNNVTRNTIDSRVHRHGDWSGKMIHADRRDFISGKKLRPNVAYVSGDNNYIYQTDSAGRIQNATGVLLLGNSKRKRIPDNKTPGKLPGDHASHILGDLFGGSPGLENLISLGARINQSDHAKIERRLKRALENNEDVYVDYEFHYSRDSKRPDWFTITFYNGTDLGAMKPISIVVDNSDGNPPRQAN